MHIVGSRPWQILHTYPIPEQNLEVPFHVAVSWVDSMVTGTDSILLHINRKVENWNKWPLRFKEIAAVIALDMATHKVERQARESRTWDWPSGRDPVLTPWDDFTRVREYLTLIETWPNPRKYLTKKRWMREELEEDIQANRMIQSSPSIGILWDAVESLITYQGQTGQKIEMRLVDTILFSITILSGLVETPLWTRLNQPPSSLYLIYQDTPETAQIISSLANNARRWLAIWWQEVKNTLAWESGSIIN